MKSCFAIGTGLHHVDDDWIFRLQSRMQPRLQPRFDSARKNKIKMVVEMQPRLQPRGCKIFVATSRLQSNPTSAQSSLSVFGIFLSVFLSNRVAEVAIEVALRLDPDWISLDLTWTE